MRYKIRQPIRDADIASGSDVTMVFCSRSPLVCIEGEICESNFKDRLGGGFQYFLCPSLAGEMIHFD